MTTNPNAADPDAADPDAADPDATDAAGAADTPGAARVHAPDGPGAASGHTISGHAIRLDALALGSLTRLEHEGTAILLCRTRDGVHAVADTCTHEDVSLSLGALHGHRLRCPLHGSEFDVRTGAVLDEPAEHDLATWPVDVVDGHVVVGTRGPTRNGFS